MSWMTHHENVKMSPTQVTRRGGLCPKKEEVAVTVHPHSHKGKKKEVFRDGNNTIAIIVIHAQKHIRTPKTYILHIPSIKVCDSRFIALVSIASPLTCQCFTLPTIPKHHILNLLRKKTTK
jgi:hypothetical protein